MSSFTKFKDKALKSDQSNLLSDFRNKFYIPEDHLYFDGNSLGLSSISAERALLKTLSQWKDKGIDGWLDSENPWYYLAENTGDKMAQLIGANKGETICTGTTTQNIHSLIGTFYDPQKKAKKILANTGNFPSDIYALESHLELRGISRDHLVLVSEDTNGLLDEESIIQSMNEDIQLIFLPSVQYKSGQLLDIPKLTSEAHMRGILIGFDCSHSAGTIPHKLHADGVDFATWCSYKYLNGGPGAPAFIFIHENHFDKLPGIRGWFGYQKDKQFNMSLDFIPSQGAGAYQVSTPVILSMAGMSGALDISCDAGIENIRKESVKMTSFLIELIEEELSIPPYQFEIASPKEAAKRGGHISIRHPEESWRICQALKKRKIIPDFRPPDIIRLACIPLYNTYCEIYQLALALKEIIDQKEYLDFPKERSAVS